MNEHGKKLNGEMMTKEVKLHIGCGTVYLEGYVNIHPEPDHMSFTAPEEVERNKTTVDKYYKDSFDSRPPFAVADFKSTIIDLPNNLGAKYLEKYFSKRQCEFVDEVCLFHVLEHLPKYDLDDSLIILNNIIKPGGKLRVAVPDFDTIVLEYAEKLKAGISEDEKEWYYRFIHGTQKDVWSHHYCGYNRHRLIKLLEKYGFDKFEDLPNQNFYPAIHLLATKHA